MKILDHTIYILNKFMNCTTIMQIQHTALEQGKNMQ